MTKDIKIHSFVRASRDAVWSALTDPAKLTAYHPAGMTVSVLPDGGQEIRNPSDGSTFIRQAMVDETPGERLELTFEPVWADVPTGGSNVVIELAEETNACKLTLIQSNCDGFGIGDNWERRLDSLKSYLETGKGLDIPPPNAS